MNQLPIIVKTAAVTSSVFLAGIFVAYRSGAFDRSRAAIDPAPALPTPAAPATESKPESTPVPALLGGSKTYSVGTLFDPGPATLIFLPPQPPQPQPIFFGGSKTSAIEPIISPRVLFPSNSGVEQALQQAALDEALKRRP